MGVKISNLPAIASPALSDIFPVVQGGVTYKESITQLSALLSTVGVSTITGTANQVIASSSTGAVTLSLPQSIATTSNVTFGSLTFSPTTSGIVGTTTNNSADAGKVGEVITAQVLVAGSPVSLTTNTPANVTSIALTAGDWDVWGNVAFVIQSGVSIVSYAAGWISGTSATLPDAALYSEMTNNTGSALTYGFGFAVPYTRVSIASPTTYYLSVQSVFSAGTLSGAGKITARRAR